VRAVDGHTLLELLVATVVSTILVIVALQAWRPASHSTLNLRDRARADTELRFAADALLADLGGAQTALPAAGGGLEIVRVPALATRIGAFSGGDDDGIVWSLDAGRLSRWDHELDTELVLADGLTGFDVDRQADETHIVLRAGAGDDARRLELVWPE
jgi:type II secretory pathway component PulJ